MIKDIIQLLIGSTIVFSTVQTQAGWSSGGGELIRDKNNPWFIQNTKTVKYCIQIDEKNFGQTRAQVSVRVKNAFEFWKRQLRDLDYHLLIGGFNSELGTQEFQETNCTKDADIQFQFGTLTAEQKQRIGDTSDVIGLTVRTDYDRVYLKGKGFIYFAPQSGPLKPTAKNVAPNMWSDGTGAAIYQLIIHELGHVFGIQHTNDIFLMREDFAEKLVSKEKFSVGRDNYFENDFSKKMKMFKFFRGQYFENFYFSKGCILDSPIHEPGGLPNPEPSDIGSRFYEVVSTHYCAISDLTNTELLVSAHRRDTKTRENIGQMSLEFPYRASLKKPVVEIWWDRQQKVLNVPSWMAGPEKMDYATMYTEYVFKGEYKSLDGKVSKKVAITAHSSGEFKVSGVSGDEILVDAEAGY